jgi:putative ABC transport system substrate-binding protein
VPDLPHPGGNATGASQNVSTSFIKGVELLRELAPGLTRVAHLANLTNAANLAVAQHTQAVLQEAGIQELLLDIHVDEDLDTAFQTAASWDTHAISAEVGGFISPDMLQRIIDFAALHKLPAVYFNRDDLPVKSGGLLAYFVASDWQYRRAAYFVDRILRGSRPADLPVEEAAAFVAAMNRSTAAALGLNIRPEVASQVTEWIQ